MIRTTTRIRRRAAAAALAVVLSVLLVGACDQADGSGVSTGNAQAEDSDRQVRYQACLREHGIDIKDGGTNGTTIDAGDATKAQAAFEACRSLSGGGAGPRELSQADKDAMLGFARCMRKNGVDMPDPVFDEGVAQAMPGAAPGPEAERFEKANATCSKEFPQSGPAGRTGAGK